MRVLVLGNLAHHLVSLLKPAADNFQTLPNHEHYIPHNHT
jgi:hypothetical protein